MDASVFLSSALEEYLNPLAAQYSEALRSKPIKRKRLDGSGFESPALATGRLANSVRVEIDAAQSAAYIVALYYVEFVVYGRRAGGMPPIERIRDWMIAKGMDGDPWALALSIAESGTSIFREFQGAASNVFEDVNPNEGFSDLRSSVFNYAKTALFGKNINLTR